jgi:zinc protease
MGMTKGDGKGLLARARALVARLGNQLACVHALCGGRSTIDTCCPRITRAMPALRHTTRPVVLEPAVRTCFIRWSCAALVLFALALSLAQAAPASSHGTGAKDPWTVPIHVSKLANGLTLVVSPDHSTPVVGISVVYRVGMRLEPKGRTGFAHLFEHLMFQGTPQAGKGVFDRVITGGGGSNNGSTRPDFTNYIESAPTSALESMLWLEADRMKTLDFNPATLKNQQDVVKEEIRVNVKNQPYGGFMWIDISQLAFQKWENKHDGYGSFEDLERADLSDVRDFHRDFYGPNNAVLSMAGDVTPARALTLAKKYFGEIPRRETAKPVDFGEGLNTAERRLSQSDALAQVPALAAAWKMPERGSKDQAPMAVLGELLAGGNASLFYQGLVKGKELALNVESLYGLTSPWEYDGPTLFTVFALYKATGTADAVLAAMDEEIKKLVQDGVDDATLKRVKARMLADWYDGLEAFIRRADTLAKLQALWGDAKVANQIPQWIAAVTSADIQRAAKTYLTVANRSVIDRKPGPPAVPAAAASAASAAAPSAASAAASSAAPAAAPATASPAASTTPAPAPGLGPLPASLPPYAKDKPLPVPNISKQVLDNGMQVWVVPRQGLPRVDYVLAVRGAGLAADEATQPAFASLLASLLKEGTANKDSRAIAEAAQALGGALGAEALMDGINLNGNALASNAAPMLMLLADVARQATFPDAEVQLAKDNALQALKVSEATPRFRAERALAQAIYGSHPYGSTQPTEAAINATTAAQLRSAHAQRFRPDRSLLVVSGRISATDAMKLAQAAFGDWQNSGPALLEPADAPALAVPQRLLLDRPGSVQATLRIGRPGLPATHADHVPLRLTSTILGDGFSSRINLNLREEKGYTYGASARARSYAQGGGIVGGADVRNEVTGAALQEYISEYRRIGTELVGADELALNKRFLAGDYLVSNQLQGAVAQTLARNWLVGQGPEFLGRFVPLLQQVTAEQVRTAAAKYFAPDSQSIVVVGDKAAIADQLKALGDFKAEVKTDVK